MYSAEEMLAALSSDEPEQVAEALATLKRRMDHIDEVEVPFLSKDVLKAFRATPPIELKLLLLELILTPTADGDRHGWNR
jgi:hypothetical protein